MPVIVVFNQKGGCGKTTLTLNLAAWLRSGQRRVTLLDADPQQTLAGWLRQRQLVVDCLRRIELRIAAGETLGRTQDDVERAARGCRRRAIGADDLEIRGVSVTALTDLEPPRRGEIVLIDTPPVPGTGMLYCRRAARLAAAAGDVALAVVPIGPSAFDLREAYRCLGSGDLEVPAVLVVTNIGHAPSHLRAVQREAKRIGTLAGVLPTRVAHYEAQASGLGVVELSPAAGAAADDVERLGRRILRALKEPK